MSMPLHRSEVAFNCAELTDSMVLERPLLDSDESKEGRVLIWKVLSFGVRPNRLVFARVVSVAARTGQALFRTRANDPKGHQSAGPLRLQLYVDDPVAGVSGTAAQRTMNIDMFLTWWLVLGVPLAWKKRGSARRRVHMDRGVVQAPPRAALS